MTNDRPEPKHKQKDDGSGKSIPMKKAIAKLIARGIPTETIRKLTQYQLFSIFEEMDEEDKFRVQLAYQSFGEDESGDREATLQDLLGFGM